MKKYLQVWILTLFSALGNSQHISEFVSLSGGGQNSTFEYPQDHTFQYIIEHGDDLSTGALMDDNFDFTGYVPISGSSELGYLSISHEKTPGGVTIMDIEFDSNIQSWNHSLSSEVDFSIVGGTSRNCSGTVTPWGTIVTSEENVSADTNGDGYLDIGWNVEIDPVSRAVVNYTGGLSQGDKMWALGNFKHENVVVHSNRRTVYQAEDAGSGHIYKFVADQAEDFSSGDLYVYVGPKNGNGHWVQLNNDTAVEQNSVISQANNVSATNFSGGEDVEISPIDNKVYVAMKSEKCVYRFKDVDPLSGGAVNDFEVYVGNTNYDVLTENGIVNVNWGSGNDNLAFDDKGNLWVLQDGSNNHIWVVDEAHSQLNPKVRIFGHSPAGSEPTGITFSPDYRFLFMSFQHPSASNSDTEQNDAFQEPRKFDKDVAVVISRKHHLGNCHKSQNIEYDLNRNQNFSVSENILAESKIDLNAAVNFYAGEAIEMGIGFEVKVGASFLATIQNCTVQTP